MSARHSIVCFVLLAALAACTPSPKDVEPVETPVHKPVETPAPEPVEGPTPELSAIDSLMWQHPDSALQCLLARRDAMIASPDTVDSGLRRIQCISSTTFDDHYANLLLAELLYKNDYAQTNRAELLRAVGYFDSLLVPAGGADTRGVSLRPRRRRDARRATAQHRAFLDARAHYINGVGYYEKDSVVDACKEYLKALEVMEGGFEEEELVGNKAQFMAMAYTRLTVIFSDLYLNKQAVYFGKLSLPYYERNKISPWHLPWMLSKIGSHYNMMDELDSANYYYQQAKISLPDTTNQTYRDIVARQAFLSYQMKHQFEKSMSILHHMVALATTDDERLARYISIGEICYFERQFDSAKVYFEYGNKNTLRPDSRMLSLERLQEISLAEGDTLKANEYALARTQFINVKDEEGNLLSMLTTLCQQYEQSRQEAQHRQKIQKTARRWGIVLGLASFVVAMASLLLVVLRRRMRSEQYSHKMQQAALTGKLRKSNEALRNVTQQFEQAMAKSVSVEESETPDDYDAFMNALVCQHIIRIVHKQQFKSKVDYLIYKDDALSKEQILALRDAAERHLTRFTSRIRRKFPNLTEGDMDYCYLFLLGLNEADISALLQRAYSTVCERSRKINRIIEAKGDLYHTLRNMLSD